MKKRGSKKECICIIGALWTDNFGDVLLAKLFSEFLGKLGFDVRSPRIIDSISRETGVRKASIRNIITSKGVIFIGGGYLSEPPEKPHRWALSRYLRIFIWGDLCRLMRKPYSIIGVGAGPCESLLTRFFVRRFCDGSERRVVRDETSRQVLKGIGVKKPISVAADYALTIKSCSHETRIKGADEEKIGIHLSAKAPALVKAILDLPERGLDRDRMWYIEDHPGEYERLRTLDRRIVDFFEGRIIRYEHCDQFLEEIADMDFIVTSKLHIGIVACAMGKRVCSVPYHAKVARFYEDVGRPELCHHGSEEGLVDHIIHCYAAPPVTVPDWMRLAASMIEDHIRADAVNQWR